MDIVRAHQYKVGDRVRFQWGVRKVVGTVVEDRGGLGVDGEQIVRVEAPIDPTYVYSSELPAAVLEPARRRTRGKPASR